ncbi:hypothetical protein ERD78_18340 [Allopusillimonas soli]|uniref:Uncharacterized protein n=1 Tax=Allopusillimonas soli TaxID=659016 RepID=A0A853FFT4_9BURK|nr:hypothetical protein [Allopusillimonas soli]NYT38747.1 hypothetical protein [Allopusillimonas soli]TEA70269.1 hypothetical protein ERD78_18340 [Allopusillimonas soli]
MNVHTRCGPPSGGPPAEDDPLAGIASSAFRHIFYRALCLAPQMAECQQLQMAKAYKCSHQPEISHKEL